MLQEKLFQKKIQSGQIDHAYLLVSSDREILQRQTEYLQKQLKLNQFEIIQIQPEDKKNGEITVSMMRRLRSELNSKAASGKRLVIIDGAETVNAEAANSFLKTLEEPPLDTVIVMLSKSDDILPTIISRSQVYHFPSLSRSYQLFQPAEIEKFRAMNLKERFTFADKVVKNNQTEMLLEDLLSYFFAEFRSKPSNQKVIEQIEQAKKRFIANVSAKLLLENVFLII